MLSAPGKLFNSSKTLQARYYYFHFADEKIKAQINNMPKSHCWEVIELGLESVPVLPS